MKIKKYINSINKEAYENRLEIHLNFIRRRKL